MKHLPDIEYFNTNTNKWCNVSYWHLVRLEDYKKSCQSFEDEVVVPLGTGVFTYDYDWVVCRMNKISKFNFRLVQ